MSQSKLLSLIPEVKVLIFDHLSDIDLIRCSTVCRLFRQVIARSALVQYRIELSFEGLVDGHPDGPNVTDRLRRLLDRRSNWLNLNWKEHKPMSLRTRITHYAPGLLLTQEALKDGSEGSRRLIFHTLPSWETGTLEIRQGPPHERHIESMTCDPNQDLFIIFELDDSAWDQDNDVAPDTKHWFHFLTLSSQGESAHHYATSSVIEVPYLRGHEGPMTLCLMGDLLGVLSNPEGDIALNIINWKSGEHITAIESHSCPLPVYDMPGAFAFATPQLLLLLFSGGHCACLQIQPIPSTNYDSLVLCLPSPRFHHNADPIIFENPMASNSRPGMPFRASPDDWVYHIDFPAAQFALFFKHTSLMSLLAEHVWSQPSNKPVVVPWKTWGPRHTRAVRCRVYPNESGCVYGSRAVLLMADIAGTRDVRFAKETHYILDFNLIRHRRPTLLSEDTASNGKWTLVSKPTSLSLPKFADPIVTSLPFYVAPAPGKGQPGRYCIGDQRVIEFTPLNPEHTSWNANQIEEVNVYSF